MTAADMDIHKRALLGGVTRALGLLSRMPALLKLRDWPYGDRDLVAVLCAAVACKRAGAGAQRFRRPDGAEGCDGAWPVETPSLTASDIVHAFELVELLEP